MKKSLGAKALVLPTPVFVVGSYDGAGRPNMMTVAWGGICSSDPPSIAISIRETRYTYENIVRTQAFTVNIPSAGQAKQADYVGICSGRGTDKFAHTGLTAVKSSLVDAPYIQEFPLALECKVTHTLELGAHVQFVGEILDVKANADIIDEDGIINVAKLQPISFSPSDGGYYHVGEYLGQAFAIGHDI